MHFPSMRPALAAFALLATAAQAQTVTPPPLPAGSQLVRPEPGMNEPERKRYVRAHHHKAHHGRDYTRDDSVHGPEPVPASTTAAGSGVPSGAAVMPRGLPLARPASIAGRL